MGFQEVAARNALEACNGPGLALEGAAVQRGHGGDVWHELAFRCRSWELVGPYSLWGSLESKLQLSVSRILFAKTLCGSSWLDTQ